MKHIPTIINVFAGNTIEGIFGIKLGVPYPLQPVIEMESVSLPFTVIRAPVPENHPIKAFYDYSISINTTKHVASIRAKRAYNKHKDCLEERDFILKYLKK